VHCPNISIGAKGYRAKGYHERLSEHSAPSNFYLGGGGGGDDDYDDGMTRKPKRRKGGDNAARLRRDGPLAVTPLANADYTGAWMAPPAVGAPLFMQPPWLMLPSTLNHPYSVLPPLPSVMPVLPYPSQLFMPPGSTMPMPPAPHSLSTTPLPIPAILTRSSSEASLRSQPSSATTTGPSLSPSADTFVGRDFFLKPTQG